MKVAILNGPNLNLLGTREPHIYGRESLEEIAARCRAAGSALGVDVDFKQSNSEGQLVDWVQAAEGESDALIINAAAYTHTSIALHDALTTYSGFTIELHISHPHSREHFRRHSYISSAADAVVAGLGADGYIEAVGVLPAILGQSG